MSLPSILWRWVSCRRTCGWCTGHGCATDVFSACHLAWSQNETRLSTRWDARKKAKIDLTRSLTELVFFSKSPSPLQGNMYTTNSNTTFSPSTFQPSRALLPSRQPTARGDLLEMKTHTCSSVAFSCSHILGYATFRPFGFIYKTHMTLRVNRCCSSPTAVLSCSRLPSDRCCFLC